MGVIGGDFQVTGLENGMVLVEKSFYVTQESFTRKSQSIFIYLILYHYKSLLSLSNLINSNDERKSLYQVLWKDEFTRMEIFGKKIFQVVWVARFSYQSNSNPIQRIADSNSGGSQFQKITT